MQAQSAAGAAISVGTAGILPHLTGKPTPGDKKKCKIFLCFLCKTDALAGGCGCVTNGVIFRKAQERCAADFAKIAQRGMGDVAPSSEKWLQAALLATTLSGNLICAVIEGGVALSFMRYRL